ncbi:MAG: phosphoglycerate dehydrogenase [Cyclobacteriaceae bacterium]|nr:phosphoglycerate dehydrogenase [Cyclobacteriaceae bacterium]
MIKKVLISDVVHESLMPMLNETGYLADYRPDIKRDEILQVLPEYKGIVVRSKTPIDRELLDAGTQLLFVARSGAGLDQIDMEHARKRGISIINAPEGNRDAVAEHAVGMILALLNKLHTADQEVRSGIWDREGNRGYELGNMCVGIIGCGFMGQAFAQRLPSFGCRVLGYDKYKTGFGNANLLECNLEQIFEEADLVSFHIPLTEETRFYINEDFIGRFKKNFFFVNTARGEIVKFETLLKFLNSGKIRGAALDVLENEKFSKYTDPQKAAFEALKQLPNVIFSPHVAGWTHESYVKINQTMVNKIKLINLP